MKLNDVLKGKSEEDILSSMENLSPNDLLLKSIEAAFLFGVKKAIEMGANVHTLNDNPLQWASHKGHYDIVELLLKNDADVHALDDFALRWASKNGHLDVVELLLKNGADVHVKNDAALQWASNHNHLNVIKLLKKYM